MKMNSLLTSKLYDNDTFYKAFTRDLLRARDYVLIESPFITSRRMNELVPILAKLRRRNVRIIINTRNPDEHVSEYQTQALEAVEALQTLGVTVLYTVKHHRKLAVIDKEIVWEGSLNILSQNDSCEMMRRSVSSFLAMETLNFIGAQRWL